MVWSGIEAGYKGLVGIAVAASVCGTPASILWKVAWGVHDLFDNYLAVLRLAEASLLDAAGIMYPPDWRSWLVLLLALLAVPSLTPEWLLERRKFTGWSFWVLAFGLFPMSAMLLVRIVVFVVESLLIQNGTHMPGWCVGLADRVELYVTVPAVVFAFFLRNALRDSYGREDLTELDSEIRKIQYFCLMLVGPLVLSLILDSLLAGAVTWLLAFVLLRVNVIVGRKPAVVVTHPRYALGDDRTIPRKFERRFLVGFNLGGYVFPLVIGVYCLCEVKEALMATKPGAWTLFVIIFASAFVAAAIDATPKRRRGIFANALYLPLFAALTGLGVAAIEESALLITGSGVGWVHAARAAFAMLSISSAIAADAITYARAALQRVDLRGCIFGGLAELDGVFVAPISGVALIPVVFGGIIGTLLLPILPLVGLGVISGGIEAPSKYIALWIAGLATLPAFWYRVVVPALDAMGKSFSIFLAALVVVVALCGVGALENYRMVVLYTLAMATPLVPIAVATRDKLSMRMKCERRLKHEILRASGNLPEPLTDYELARIEELTAELRRFGEALDAPESVEEAVKVLSRVNAPEELLRNLARSVVAMKAKPLGVVEYDGMVNVVTISKGEPLVFEIVPPKYGGWECIEFRIPHTVPLEVYERCLECLRGNKAFGFHMKKERFRRVSSDIVEIIELSYGDGTPKKSKF